MPSIPRAEILAKFRKMIADKHPIIGGGAGTGLSAKCEAAGGIDLIVIYNSGRYRMAGRGSLAGVLAYGNANQIVMDMAREVLPVVGGGPPPGGGGGGRGRSTTPSTPCVRVAGGGGGGGPPPPGGGGVGPPPDPFVDFDVFLDDVKRVGFSGIQNFPTVGLIDGNFRRNLEETGMSYALEVDVVARAHKKDLLTTPYVFDAEQARDMTKAGADVLVAHMGLTSGGAIGAGTTMTLEQSITLINEISEAARSIRPDVMLLCHGGPIAMPDDAQKVLDNCPDCHGFYGASSMERLPVEVALTEQTRRFKAMKR
ncbi:phosphoenolpyruvate hydrolase family protein [Novacetimonas hansenii]|uniref:phosphoenolpyruvate hydrolase family protein n=1 Tax=Novacetimonas hansenii TaxID=436 RepID=UPI0039ED55BC